jgi:hypothetical protein
MEWVASKRHMIPEHRLPRAVQTLQADVYSSPASSRLNLHPLIDLNGLVRFRRKMKSVFCACAITFQTQSTNNNKNIGQAAWQHGKLICSLGAN